MELLLASLAAYAASRVHQARREGVHQAETERITPNMSILERIAINVKRAV